MEGILATMYDGRTLHGREVYARVLEAFGDKVFDSVIYRTVRFPETTVAGEPITSWAPTSNGAVAYRELAMEVLPPVARPVTRTPVLSCRRGGRRCPGGPARGVASCRRTAGPLVLDGGRGFQGAAGQLRRSVRPAAEPDQSSTARRHGGGVVAGHRRVHRLSHGRRDEFDLGQATEFLVVAGTLLDLKAARLLPAADVDDEEDLALLEARDLLFARLLQYRAYKLAAAHLGRAGEAGRPRYGGTVELERGSPPSARSSGSASTPPVRRDRGRAPCAPSRCRWSAIDHIHAPRVSVREHMA